MPGYLHQFVRAIVIKMKTIRKAPLQSLVHLHQSFHFVYITSQYNQHVRMRLRQNSQQTFDNMVTKVFTVVQCIAQCVGFVDKQYVSTS